MATASTVLPVPGPGYEIVAHARDGLDTETFRYAREQAGHTLRHVERLRAQGYLVELREQTTGAPLEVREGAIVPLAPVTRCGVPGCANRVAAKGLCLSHYKATRAQARPHGDCIAVGCDSYAEGARHGLCNRHYLRLSRGKLSTESLARVRAHQAEMTMVASAAPRATTLHLPRPAAKKEEKTVSTPAPRLSTAPEAPVTTAPAASVVPAPTLILVVSAFELIPGPTLAATKARATITATIELPLERALAVEAALSTPEATTQLQQAIAAALAR